MEEALKYVQILNKQSRNTSIKEKSREKNDINKEKSEIDKKISKILLTKLVWERERDKAKIF